MKKKILASRLFSLFLAMALTLTGILTIDAISGNPNSANAVAVFTSDRTHSYTLTPKQANYAQTNGRSDYADKKGKQSLSKTQIEGISATHSLTMSPVSSSLLHKDFMDNYTYTIRDYGDGSHGLSNNLGVGDKINGAIAVQSIPLYSTNYSGSYTSTNFNIPSAISASLPAKSGSFFPITSYTGYSSSYIYESETPIVTAPAASGSCPLFTNMSGSYGSKEILYTSGACGTTQSAPDTKGLNQRTYINKDYSVYIYGGPAYYANTQLGNGQYILSKIHDGYNYYLYLETCYLLNKVDLTYDGSTANYTLNYKAPPVTISIPYYGSASRTYTGSVNYYAETPAYFIAPQSNTLSNEVGSNMTSYQAVADKVVAINDEENSVTISEIAGRHLNNVSGGTEYTINYTNAKTPAYSFGVDQTAEKYISAVLYKASDLNTPLRYARLAKVTSASGSTSIRIPSDLEVGTEYALALFEETSSTDKTNAYSMSTPTIVTFEPKSAAETSYATGIYAKTAKSSVEYGDLLSTDDILASKVLFSGEILPMENSDFYIVSADLWSSLGDDIKTDEEKFKKIEGVNYVEIPSKETLGSKTTYDIMVVFFDKSEKHGGQGTGYPATVGTSCGLDKPYTRFETVIQASLAKEVIDNGNSYTDKGVTWYYDKNDGDHTVSNVYTSCEDVNRYIQNGVFHVPSSLMVDGVEYTVKSIGSGMKEFPFIPANVNAFTSIEFPEGIEINNYAFYGNQAPAIIEIPESVTKVGDFAFYGCDKITMAEIHSATLGTGAFGHCDSLTEVCIDGTGSIGRVAFAECKGLEKVVISGKTSIGNNAFTKNKALKIVNLDNLTDAVIGENAFLKESSIQTLTMKNMTGCTINNSAFKDCTGIESLYVPNGGRTVTEGEGESAVEKVVGENQVKAFAFTNCRGLRTLEIDLTTVENDAFSGCGSSAGTTIIFGENVKVVSYNWGGYNEDDYTSAVNVDLYVKGKNTHFETYKNGSDYYSAFCGHNNSSVEYKRNVVLHFSSKNDAKDNSGTTDTSSMITATPGWYYSTIAKNTEESNTVLLMANANNLWDISIATLTDGFDNKADSITETAEEEVNRTGITAYYNGKVYNDETHGIDKTKFVVKESFSDGSTGKTFNTSDFYFVKASDYTSFAGTKAEFEEAYAGLFDTFDVTTCGDEAELVLVVIEETTDEETGEVTGTVSTTSITIPVFDYTSQEIIGDSGFSDNELANVVKAIMQIQIEAADNAEKIEEMIRRVDAYEGLVADKEQLTAEKERLTSLVEKYNNAVVAMNQIMNEIKDTITMDANGYTGIKTAEDGSTSKVVFLGDTFASYTIVDEVNTLEDGSTFTVDESGVHVTNTEGETTDYTDTVAILTKKMTAQLVTIRATLANSKTSINALKEALGITDEDFDDKSQDEQLAVIVTKVEELIGEKEALEEELAEVTQQVADYQSAMEDIYEQLTSGTLNKEEVNTLEGTLNVIIEEITSLQSTLSQKIDKIAELEAEIERLGGEISDKDDIISDKDGIINDKNATIEDLNKAKENLEKELKDLEALTENQATTIAGLEGQISTLETTKQNQEQTIAGLESDKAALESQNAELGSKLESLKSNITALEESNKKQDESIKKLLEDLDVDTESASKEDLQELLTTASETISEMKTTNQAQAATILSLNSNITDLETLRDEQAATIASLGVEISDLKNQNETLASTIESMKVTAESLKTDNSALSESIQSMKTELEGQANSIASLNATITDLQNQLAEKNALVEDLQKQLDALGDNATVWVLTAEDAETLFGAKGTTSEIREAINNFVAAKVKAESTIHAIQTKLNTTATGDELVALVGTTDGNAPSGDTNNNSALTAENTALKSENAKLQAELQTMKNLVDQNAQTDSNAQTAKLNATISELTTQLSTSQKENTTLVKENTLLKSENETVTAENEALTGAMDDLLAYTLDALSNTEDLFAKKNALKKTTVSEKKAQIQKNISSILTYAKTMKDTASSYQSKYTQTKSKYDKAKDKYDSAKKTNTSLKKKNETLAKANASLGSQVTNLQNQLKAANSKANAVVATNSNGSTVVQKKTYTVIFKDYDEKILQTKIYEAGEEIQYPEDPTRDGYVFSGWNINPSTANQDYTVLALYKVEDTSEKVDIDIDVKQNEVLKDPADAINDAIINSSQVTDSTELDVLSTEEPTEIDDTDNTDKIETKDNSLTIKIVIAIIIFLAIAGGVIFLLGGKKKSVED